MLNAIQMPKGLKYHLPYKYQGFKIQIPSGQLRQRWRDVMGNHKRTSSKEQERGLEKRRMEIDYICSNEPRAIGKPRRERERELQIPLEKKNLVKIFFTSENLN